MLNFELNTTSHFTSRLRKNDILALYDVLMSDRDDYIHVVSEFTSDVYIDAAVGKQLDGCGDILGQPRLIPNAMYKTFFGYRGQPNTKGYGQARYRRAYENAKSVSYELLDEDYRQLLKWRRHENFSRGTVPDVKKSVQLFLSTDNVACYSENMTIVVVLQRDQVESSVFTELLPSYITLPVGIGLDVRLIDKLDANTKPITPDDRDPDEPDWWYDDTGVGSNIGTNGSPDWIHGKWQLNMQGG